MLLYKNRIVVTGGSGRFGSLFKLNLNNKKYNYFFPTKKKLNILNQKSILKYLKINKPKYLIHMAGLSRPMNIHEKNINKSIDLNIIGTANITKCCSLLGIKLIFFSTAYVYPGISGNYREDSPINPINNYGLSKMGGEAAVRMYNNSLILRISMTEKPFIHKHAFYDFVTNFIFHDEVAFILPKLLNYKGIINLGGKSRSVYEFAKKYKKNINKISAKKVFGKNAKLNVSMNTKRLRNIIND